MSYKTTDTILYVDNVSFAYADGSNEVKYVLKDITMVEKDVVRDGIAATGQTIAVLGRSGRGKSTLFKGLTGLMKPISGKILITDLRSETKDDAKEVEEGDVGFVDQKYTLFRHKTILQMFNYALRTSKLNKNEKKELINKYLIEWGLDEHKNKYPCELSGGQRQRTAIIEQMLTSKHFMVFDEPFSGLDVGNIEKVKIAFDKILSSDELNTIIFSTHDIDLAVQLADSIYVIGHPEGVSDYSTIIGRFDLKEMGIAWEGHEEEKRSLGVKIKELLLKS